MPRPILTLVDDLIFLSKIQQTAKQMGVVLEAVEPSMVRERAAQTSAHSIILDLNHRSGAAIKVARALKGDSATSHVQVVGFLSHVQTDLATAARSRALRSWAACDDCGSFGRHAPDE